MPFTFSHPALILPVYRVSKRYVSLTGLIFGSLSPDFEYFFRMEKGESRFSHTLPGLFLFDFPIALLLATLFHMVTRNALIDNLPSYLFRKFARHRTFRWNMFYKNNVLMVMGSILIGALSHLLWDWFVHGNFHIVGRQPVVSLHLFTFHFRLETYHVFHYINSLLGIFFLFYAIAILPDEPAAKKTGMPFIYWTIVALLSTTAVWIRLHFDVGTIYLDDKIVTVIAAFLLSLLVTPLLLNPFRFLYLKKVP